MTKTLLIFACSGLLLAQTAQFPGAVATDNNLKVAKNNVASPLGLAMGASDTVFTVSSGAGFSANTLATIQSEIVAICSVVGVTVTVGQSSCPNVDGRGFDNTTATTHAAGTTVSLYVDAWHHNASRVEVEAVETALGANLANIPGSPNGGAVPISKGGTGATSQSAALANILGSSTIGITNGGTGANTPSAALANILGSSTIGLSNGGTGATTQTGALAAILGGSTIQIANGGTGQSTQSAALTALLGSSLVPVANGGTGVSAAQGVGDTKVQLANGTVTSGHVPQYDSNGGLIDSGSGPVGGITQLTADVTAGPGTGSTAATLVAIKGVPFCTGYTPTTGQSITYTTASSPNPCYAASAPAAGSVSIGATVNSGTTNYLLSVGSGPVLAQQQYLSAAQTPAFTGDVLKVAGSLATTVTAIDGVPFCAGFTPTTGQALEYTTASSPNPCYTATSISGGGNVSTSGTTAQYSLGVYASTTGLAQIIPSSTPGVPLISQGSSAYPTYGPINLGGGAFIVNGVLPPANGGTGVANVTTITLGTASHNYALLGTGIVKNTTTTGALSIAVASDIYGLWSGTCSSVTVLHGAGACGPVVLTTDVSGSLANANGGTAGGASQTALTGTANGVNVTFTMGGTVHSILTVLRNGLVQDPNSAYSITGSTVTFTNNNPYIPQSGDDLEALIF